MLISWFPIFLLILLKTLVTWLLHGCEYRIYVRHFFVGANSFTFNMCSQNEEIDLFLLYNKFLSLPHKWLFHVTLLWRSIVLPQGLQNFKNLNMFQCPDIWGLERFDTYMCVLTPKHCVSSCNLVWKLTYKYSWLFRTIWETDVIVCELANSSPHSTSSDAYCTKRL